MNKYAIVLPVFLVGILTGKILFGGSSSGTKSEESNPAGSVSASPSPDELIGNAPVAPDSSQVHIASLPSSEGHPVTGGEQDSQKGNQKVAESESSKNPSLTREACFDILVPSDIGAFQRAMHERVSEFLSRNEEIWTGGTPESAKLRDYSTLEQSLGDYEYQFEVDSSVIHGEGKFNLKVVPHTGKVTGDFELKNFRRGKNGKSEYTSGAYGEIGDPDVGTDPQNMQTHFVWTTPGVAHPELENDPARKLVRYGIKIPTGMTPGSTKTLDLYGLHETLKWNRVERVHLKRVAETSLN